jgi:hypothetical protein
MKFRIPVLVPNTSLRRICLHAGRPYGAAAVLGLVGECPLVDGAGTSPLRRSRRARLICRLAASRREIARRRTTTPSSPLPACLLLCCSRFATQHMTPVGNGSSLVREHGKLIVLQTSEWLCKHFRFAASDTPVFSRKN